MVTRFALIFGLVYAVVGILGFIPPLVTTPEMDPDLIADEGHGRLFGLFAVNLWHNLVHLAMGVWGIVAAVSGFNGSRLFARSAAILFALLALLGLIPATSTLFGLVPLYGHDVWLHILSAVVAGYFGFGPPARHSR
ncbi:MAG: DUF4383 domain-containing protein [Halomonadaceae bacterium]|nr:MAG: DUF4383 domain-containing protein [Halomonadaceae bacterium]